MLFRVQLVDSALHANTFSLRIGRASFVLASQSSCLGACRAYLVCIPVSFRPASGVSLEAEINLSALLSATPFALEQILVARCCCAHHYLVSVASCNARKRSEPSPMWLASCRLDRIWEAGGVATSLILQTATYADNPYLGLEMWMVCGPTGQACREDRLGCRLGPLKVLQLRR